MVEAVEALETIHQATRMVVLIIICILVIIFEGFLFKYEDNEILETLLYIDDIDTDKDSRINKKHKKKSNTHSSKNEDTTDEFLDLDTEELFDSKSDAEKILSEVNGDE